MATPVFAAALADPRFERVSIVVRRSLARILDGSVPSDSLAEVDGSAQEVEWLARASPDAVLLLSNSFGSAWRAFRARVPQRIGTALSGRRWLLTHALSVPTRGGRRIAIPTAELLRRVGELAGLSIADVHPRLAASDAERARSREALALLGLAQGARYFVCSPGAAYGAAKLWPPERFAGAIDEVARRTGWRAVISGGPGEEALLDSVALATRSQAVSLARTKRDLGDLRALIADAELLLVGDSGPRWYAAAFDVPCVSVMGPNAPELTATSLEFAEIVRVAELECSPCMQRTCPLGHHRCMTEISIDDVVGAAERVLARRTRFDAARGASAR